MGAGPKARTAWGYRAAWSGYVALRTHRRTASAASREAALAVRLKPRRVPAVQAQYYCLER
jgi:hypothetical protein